MEFKIHLDSVIVGCIVSVFIKSIWTLFTSSNNQDDEMNKKNITNKDLFYWMFFLVILCISIVSKKFYNEDTIIDYISFSGTIISIILGVIAIIYSFFQGYDSNKSVAEMYSMVSELKETIKELNKIHKIMETSTELQDKTEKLYENLEDMIRDKVPKVIDDTVRESLDENLKKNYTRYVEEDIGEDWEIPF